MDWASWQPRELATLCFVRADDRILMIRKKRGLGAGKINGVGGRLERGELPLSGILREAREELGITLIDPVKRGELHFQFWTGIAFFAPCLSLPVSTVRRSKQKRLRRTGLISAKYRSTRCGRMMNSGFGRRSRENLFAVSLYSMAKRC
jgi:8-oxo-dGTP pyrophosphatase MutT (NUDIX family)